ncbi:DUF423 domain-containing protein [Dyella sedimenti]|uniref:DUF423 domain-containing protein n=1 Tax=Dyella sedimenti TaxID=2919947 RepID=UPI001FAA9F67|nr:DUF423 domain-containing protein [Dyella sedimenti]
MRRSIPTVGLLVGLAGASAVMLGAFGAHALRDVLDARGTELWHTAVSYHFWHALALVLAVSAAPGRARRVASACFALGIVVFCGTLYALALGAPRWVGAITPVGGVSFIVGWLALGLALAPLLARDPH